MRVWGALLMLGTEMMVTMVRAGRPFHRTATVSLGSPLPLPTQPYTHRMAKLMDLLLKLASNPTFNTHPPGSIDSGPSLVSGYRHGFKPVVPAAESKHQPSRGSLTGVIELAGGRGPLVGGKSGSSGPLPPSEAVVQSDSGRFTPPQVGPQRSSKVLRTTSYLVNREISGGMHRPLDLFKYRELMKQAEEGQAYLRKMLAHLQGLKEKARAT